MKFESNSVSTILQTFNKGVTEIGLVCQHPWWCTCFAWLIAFSMMQFWAASIRSSEKIYLRIPVPIHELTHWLLITVEYVEKVPSLVTPKGHQAITWTNDESLSIWPLGTRFSEILTKIHNFSSKNMCLKVSSAKCQPCIQASMR